ncbi:phosphate ABC transporter permease PstA [Amycolatopsis suaedae]|uniref:Phosphate transport system permease protein PstA n=1 Tax=Amycolatopsis suaedae TaxID=2510978 RepID=A0A4Q7J044_9PSEU|nr:phosphate ABC transporter permease PstA [Amycolatopsis suaedae]RZQ59733.1 phosphate ABC transporter permease PstA [Amycolatopsis suaedae]
MLEAPAPPPRRPVRRRTSVTTREDRWVLLGCAISSALFTWFVMRLLLDSPGWLADLIVGYLLFLVMQYLVFRDRAGRLAATDRLVTTVVFTGMLGLLIPLLFLLSYIVVRGAPNLRLNFFAEDSATVSPVDPATAGGGLHAITGTLEQTALALLLVVPLGLLTAIFLNETRSRFRKPVRIFVDAMSGLPSVIAGLFIYAALVIPGALSGSSLFNYNGLMASFALSIVMLPTVTRTVDVVLRLVPDGLREASLALGASRARTVWSVVLPTARTGVTTAIILGIARVVGETAPLLFTSFGATVLNANPFAGTQESLPLFVYRNIQQPVESMQDRGYVGALVLIIVIFLLFALARLAGRGRTKRRARRTRRQERT